MATTNEGESPATGRTTPRMTTPYVRSAEPGRADIATMAGMFVNLVELSLEGRWFICPFYQLSTIIVVIGVC